MAGLSVSIEFYWEEQPGDCTLCVACNEPMYLKKFVGIIRTGNKTVELDAALCEACYDLIDG